MKLNINHKNSFITDEIKVEKPIAVKPVVEVKEEPVVIDEKFFYDMTSSEQKELLAEHGLSKKEIKALKYEEDRVKALMKFNCFE